MATIQEDRKALIEEGVEQAFTADGYSLAEGRRDMVRIRGRIIKLLEARKVLAPKEREAKAVPKGEVVAALFPSLPEPPDFKAASDQLLAAEVWNKVTSILWSEMAPNANKALQREVGTAMGNGYVLCRTQVNKGSTWAVYITDNVQCIEQDFVRPDNDALERKIRSVVANREMLILRQPDNGDRWLKGFDRYLKAVGSRAREQLTLTYEASNGHLTDGSEDVAGDED